MCASSDFLSQAVLKRTRARDELWLSVCLLLNAKHGGTVKGERSLVPAPYPLVSGSLGHTASDKERFGPEQYVARFFTIVDNYDRFNANERR